MTRRPTLVYLFAGATAIMPVAVPGSAVAQRGAPSSVSGVILDSQSSAPIGLAWVTILPAPQGLFPPGAGSAGTFFTTSQTRVTGENGEYRFEGLAAGSYRLMVRRIGFRPSSVDVELGTAQRFQLSVGLVVAPIRLTPLAVDVSEPLAFGPVPRDTPNPDRAERERIRQDAFPETDARTLSYDEVAESVGMGETDLFRSMQHFPGVATRDNWTAEMWIRGAAWDRTTVYFDDAPILNSVHGGGLLSSVNPDAVGSATFHPGARSAEFGAGSASVVRIRSRSAGGTGDLRGRATLSPFHAGLALDRRWLDGRLGAVVAVRRSWLGHDRRFSGPSGDLLPAIPNDFADAVARVDYDLGPASIEASGAIMRDWLRHDLDGGPVGNRATWGTTLGQVAVNVPLKNGLLRTGIVTSRYRVDINQTEPRSALLAFATVPTQEPTDLRVGHFALFGDYTHWSADRARADWRAGYRLVRETVAYVGSPTSPFSVLTYSTRPNVDGAQIRRAVWAEKWWHPAERFSVSIGARYETGPSWDPDRSNLLPRVTARYRPNPRLTLSYGVAETWQHLQSFAPTGVAFGPDFKFNRLWTLVDNEHAVHAKIQTVGGEYWLSDHWLGGATIYERSSSQLLIADPRPGSTDAHTGYVPADEDASGLELSLRKLSGSWTGALGYTVAWATLRAEGLSFPAAEDRRHSIDATLSRRVTDRMLGGSLRIGGSLTVRSGAPFTRIHPGSYDCLDFDRHGYCDPIVNTMVEAPNSARGPWFKGLDLLLDWGRDFGPWGLSAYAQVLNALNMDQAVTYRVNAAGCRRRTRNAAFCGPEDDEFIAGLRRQTELGLRLSF